MPWDITKHKQLPRKLTAAQHLSKTSIPQKAGISTDNVFHLQRFYNDNRHQSNTTDTTKTDATNTPLHLSHKQHKKKESLLLGIKIHMTEDQVIFLEL